MRRDGLGTTLWLLAALCAPLTTLAAEVVELTDESFETVYKDSPNWFIMFYAPWCGHCKRIKPIFAEAAQNAHPNVKTGLFDCTSDTGKPICEELKVSSFPSFRYNVDGGPLLKYEGPRDQFSFERFTQRLGTKEQYVFTYDDRAVKELSQRDDLVSFLFCTSSGQRTDQVMYLVHRGLEFSRCNFGTLDLGTKACGGEYKVLLINDVSVTEYPTEPADEGEEEGVETPEWHNDLEGGKALRKVLKWMDMNKHLVVDRIDQGTFQHYARSKRPFVCMFISAEGDWNDQRPYLKVLREVAKEGLTTAFSFGWLDGVSYREWIQEFFPPDGLPTVIVYHPHDEALVSLDSLTEKVHNAVSLGGDIDGSLKESIIDVIVGTEEGRYQMTYPGAAGYVIAVVSSYAPFFAPPLRSLKRSVQSDVLFIATIVLGVAMVLAGISSCLVTVVPGNQHGGQQPDERTETSVVSGGTRSPGVTRRK